ncbi:polyprenyl synthetase [uncultured Streptomyces sp.]|uniref:polyprenyl synthetase n=1 Tax=uncultured Streptomyces sp. TaxID=174707 RepID=UPI00261D9CF7|nr:polyprenyl synthetase [uncultured Streptomyces sp.]
MTHDDARGGGPAGDAVALAAGLADIAVTTLGSAVSGLTGLLRRADLGELLAEGRQDTEARGRLLLGRYVGVPPAHLEILARSVLADGRLGGGAGD